MKSLILAAFSAFVLLHEGQGQINYNLKPFAGYQPLRPLRPHFQNGFGMSNFNQNYHYGSHATNYGRRKRSPQFDQNYHPGSQSQNFNCRFGGCGNIPGMQQIHGGNVHNSGGNFNQNYFGGSHATNYGRRKTSSQFHQNYHPGSQSQNFNFYFGGSGKTDTISKGGILQIVTKTATHHYAETNSMIYFEACDTSYYTNKCCKQLLDYSGDEFQRGAVDVFEIDDEFLKCWGNSKKSHYFMSIVGNDAWLAEEITIQFQSSKEVCTSNGWLDGNDDNPEGRTILRRPLTCH